MPTKAFLHKKSLLDQFKDDYKSTGYIQSARAEHTWSNPLTRRKRTNKLNGWIKSFQGKRHVHKLARFNAMQADKNEAKEIAMRTEALNNEQFAPYHLCFTFDISEELSKRVRELAKNYKDMFVCVNDGYTDIYTNGTEELIEFLTEGELTDSESVEMFDNFRYASILDCHHSRLTPEEIKPYADKWGVRMKEHNYMSFNGPSNGTEVVLYKNLEDVMFALGDLDF